MEARRPFALTQTRSLRESGHAIASDGREHATCRKASPALGFIN